MSARFNFSLATLVLAALWAGAGMWVWAWRAPWAYVRTESRAEFENHVPPRWLKANPEIPNTAEYTPDGRRHVYRDFKKAHELHTIISDMNTKPETELFDFGIEHRAPIGFLDDDTLAFYLRGPWNDEASPEDWCEICHRRFPEWWWGHFYRPEVLLFISLSAALLWRFVLSRRGRVEKSAEAS